MSKPHRRGEDPVEAWEHQQNTLAPGETEADRLAFLDCLAELGQFTTFTETGEPAAILPHVPVVSDPAKKRQLEDEWEQRAQAMHAAQEPVELADKPHDTSSLSSKRAGHTLTRGD